MVLVLVGLPLVGVVALVVRHRRAVAVVVAGRPRTWCVRSVGASPSDEWEHPRLHNLVDGLCATMGLPRPTICVVESAVPNAMAVGRDPDSAKLVVTSGLDESLTLVELEGVLAHELVHIKRHDTVVAGVAVVATVPWALLRGNGAGRRPGAHADRAGPRVLGRPAGRRGGALSARHRLGPGDHGRATGSAAIRGRRGTVGSPRSPAGCGSIRWSGPRPAESVEGNLDDTRVRAAAQSLR